MRVVLDTPVLTAALRSHTGASSALLVLVSEGKVIPLASPPLFLEYEEVLKRPEQRLAHGLTVAQIDRFLAAFASAVEPVEIHFSWRPQVRDADDEMVLEVAVNGHADALVTHNVKDFVDVAASFQLSIWRPAEALRRVRG